MRSKTRSVVLAAACLWAGACIGPKKNRPTPEQPPTTVAVENQGFLDANIYVLRSSQRLRLGTARGNHTSEFKIPPHVIFGSTTLRFVVEPIGGRRQPTSPQISVSAGDEVQLVISPNGTLFASKQ